MEQSAPMKARLARLGEEQASLRRVATLVASGAPPEAVFQLVAEEAGRLLGASSSGIIRYELGDRRRAQIVGRWHGSDPHGFERGLVVDIEDDPGVGPVMAAMRPVRIRGFDGRPGWVAKEMQRIGFRETVSAPIVVGGHPWGALVVATAAEEPLPPETESRVDGFAAFLSLALSSAAAREELIASRERLVHAADAARRKLERDLHDGAQQRLVSLALTLRLAQARAAQGQGQAAAELIEGARSELDQALDELRELARGIHPAVLTEQGLDAAVRSLAERCPVEVEISAALGGRAPQPIEAAAYYVVSEALANVVKYAEASHVDVRLSRCDGRLVVEVTDDGRGGAVPAPGSGLTGLGDRVEALAGVLELDSPPGRGTRIRAELPLERD